MSTLQLIIGDAVFVALFVMLVIALCVALARKPPMARRRKHRGTLPPPSAQCRRDWSEFTGRI